MATPLPSVVSYTPGSTPLWAAAAQTAINAVLNAPWSFGSQRTKDVTITPATLGVGSFGASLYTYIGMALNEYRSAGWLVDMTGTTQNAQNVTVSFTLTFARWAE